jgi:hypothetical protein
VKSRKETDKQERPEVPPREPKTPRQD